MRTAIIVAAVSFGVLTTSNAQPPGGAKKPLAGDWTVVSASEDGKPLPADIVAKVFIRATATTLVPVEDGKEVNDEKLVLTFLDGKKVNFVDANKAPPRTRPGLLQFVDDNSLKIAWAEKQGKDLESVRPANFDGGAGILVFTLKRKAK